MQPSAQILEMMQALIVEGHNEIGYGGLGLYYEKLNGITSKEA